MISYLVVSVISFVCGIVVHRHIRDNNVVDPWDYTEDQKYEDSQETKVCTGTRLLENPKE